MLQRVKPSLTAIIKYGIIAGMGEAIRKITVHVPVDLLAQAQKETGEGVTETVRRGLEMLRRAHAYRELAKLRGKVKFALTADELRGDD
jgi:hypothetical protein